MKRHKGQNLSWADLIASHTSAIRFWAFKYTFNDEMAKDLAQDVVLKALQSESKFASENGNIKGWLSVMTRNIFINDYRRDKITRNQIDVSDLLYDSGLLENSIGNLAPHTIQKQSMLLLIDKLPKQLKTATLLRAEGYSYEEIGRIMDVPLGTVRSTLKRGRDKLIEMGFTQS